MSVSLVVPTADELQEHVLFQFDYKLKLLNAARSAVFEGDAQSYGRNYGYDLPNKSSQLQYNGIELWNMSLEKRFSFLRRFTKFVDHVQDTFPDKYRDAFTRPIPPSFSNFDRIEFLPFKAGGIQADIASTEYSTFAGISTDWIRKAYPEIADNSVTDNYWWAIPVRLFDESDPKHNNLLSRSYNAAFITGIGAFGYGLSADNKYLLVRRHVSGIYPDVDGNDRATVVSLRNFMRLQQAVSIVANYRPDATAVWRERKRLLADQLAIANATAQRDKLAKFDDYLRAMKNAQRSKVDTVEVFKAWNALQLLPHGTTSSRTWGIEVEVVANSYITGTPNGWDAKYDGSLVGATDVDSCGCDCEDCEDGSHCGYDDCGPDDTREYVSPILRSFHSRGLESICNDLEHAPCNDSPGIHVHVGADGLTTQDISRLAFAYAAISPFLEVLYYRNTREYCRDMSANNIKYWLAQARDLRKRMLYSEPATDNVAYQPDNRYVDVNFQALPQHGTIEFRAMGPQYDYEHLVKWAWFCREMVNVSRLDLPQTTWTSVKSFADVINILTVHGSESSKSMLASVLQEV